MYENFYGSSDKISHIKWERELNELNKLLTYFMRETTPEM